MLKRLREMLVSHWEWLRRRAPEVRKSNWETSEERARFWNEMREGRREAVARSRAQS